jgi:lipoyl(octanoyl) transferase
MMAFQYQRHSLLFYHQNFLRFRSCRPTTTNQKDIFSYFRVSRLSSLAVPSEAEVPITTSVVGHSSTVRIHNLLHQGCLPYPKTWAYQLYLLNHRLEQRRRQQQEEEKQQQSSNATFHDHDQDCVLLLEHSHVYTLGRGADETHLTFLQQQDDDDSSDDKSSYSTSITVALQKLSRKARGEGTARLTLDRRMEDQMKIMMKNNSIVHDDDDDDEKSMLRIIEKLTESISPVVAPNDVPVYRVERGGEVTYHGPKQLVVYPMLNLKTGPSLKMDLHWYLRMIEEVIIQTLAHYNIEGNRDEINTGVWVGTNKVAAVGISSSRWITTHGFALNVDPDLSYFDTSIILPCGIEGRGVTSLGEILRLQDRPIPAVTEVAEVVISIMGKVFNVKIQ